MTQPSKEATQFGNELLTAGLEPGTLLGLTRYLNTDMAWASRPIYIRECWPQIYEVFLDDAELLKLFMGQPGTGKSAALPFFAAKYVQSYRDLVCRLHPYRFWLRRPLIVAFSGSGSDDVVYMLQYDPLSWSCTGATSSWFEYKRFAWNREGADAHFVRFHNISDGAWPQSAYEAALFAATTENEELRQWFKPGRFVKCYSPWWKLPEALRARQLIADAPDGSDVADPATVEARFHQYGGLARALFFDDEVAQHERDVAEACAGSASLAGLADMAWSSTLTRRGDFTELLAGRDVRWSSDPQAELPFKPKLATWLSKQVALRWADQMRVVHAERDALRQIVDPPFVFHYPTTALRGLAAEMCAVSVVRDATRLPRMQVAAPAASQGRAPAYPAALTRGRYVMGRAPPELTWFETADAGTALSAAIGAAMNVQAAPALLVPFAQDFPVISFMVVLARGVQRHRRERPTVLLFRLATSVEETLTAAAVAGFRDNVLASCTDGGTWDDALAGEVSFSADVALVWAETQQPFQPPAVLGCLNIPQLKATLTTLK